MLINSDLDCYANDYTHAYVYICDRPQPQPISSRGVYREGREQGGGDVS